MVGFLISHRGNIDGKILHMENDPDYIQEALNLGYDVEIDVRFLCNRFFLGHDEPTYEVPISFLVDRRLWCHAKNYDALVEMAKYPIHYFWHETDRIALTSKNFIWVYPGMQPIKNSIAVLPEIYGDDVSQCIGICSDYIKNYK